MKVGVFIDVANQVAFLDSYKRGHRVNYKKYLAKIHELFPGSTLFVYAFGVYYSDDGIRFQNLLNSFGIKTLFTKEEVNTVPANRNVFIATVIFEMVDDLDAIVIGSNDVAFIPLVSSFIFRTRITAQVTPGIQHHTCNHNIDLADTDLVEQINTLKGKQ